MDELARAWLGLGEYQKGIALRRNAIAIGRTHITPVDSVAEPLDTLVECVHHTGQELEAVECWQEAAALFEHYGYPVRAATIRDRLRQAPPA